MTEAGLNSTQTRQRNPVLLIAWNATANIARFSTGWALVLITLPILVRTLSKPEYATWTLILQIGSYVLVTDASLTMAVGRFVSRFHATGNNEDLASMLSSALALVGAVSIPACICVLAAAHEIGRFLPGATPELIQAAQRALVVVGISYVIALPSSILAGVFVGYQKSGVNAVAASLARIIATAGAVIAASRGDGIVAMAVWTAIGTLFQPIIYLVNFRSLEFRPQIRYRHVTVHAMRSFTAFASAMLLTSFTGILISGLDMPVATAFDFPNAAYYAIALTVSNLLIVPFGAITAALMPMVTGEDARNTPEGNLRLLQKLSSLSNALLGLLSLGLLLAIPSLLPFWIGKENASHVAEFAILLILAQHLRLSLSAYALMGFAAGQQSRMLLSPIGEGIVNLLCSLLLASKIGATGVAVGTIIGSATGLVIHFQVSMPRTDRIALGRLKLLWSGLLRPALCILPLALLEMMRIKNWALALHSMIFPIAEWLAGLLTLALWGLSKETRNGLIVRLLAFVRPRRPLSDCD